MKIKQIIPVSGTWYAKFYCDEGSVFEPIIAWALIEDEDGERYVEGISSTGDEGACNCWEVHNLAGYINKKPASDED